MASTFVVAVFIVGLMATPAFAQTTCAAGAVAGQVVLNVGTDDVLVLASDGVEIEVSENGAALGSCAGVPITIATTDWLQILGSNAGNETVSLYDTEEAINAGWSGFTTTFDGGNGNDTLIFENGAVPGLGLVDTGAFFIGLRQAGTSIAVDVTGLSTSAEMRIDNAESIRVNGSAGDDGLCASRTDQFGGCDVDLTTQANDLVTTTGDNITLPATAPVTQGLTLNGGPGNDILASGNGDDSFLGAAGCDAVAYTASAGAVTVDLAAATGTGMGNDTLTDVQDAAGSLGDDTLLGNSLDNNLFGDEGDDTIDGREGNDGGTPCPSGILTGLNGGDDDDSLTGGTGNDIVAGNAGDDVVHEDAAANGTDALRGGPGGGCDEIDYSLRTTDVSVNETTETGWGAAGEADTGQGFEVLVTGTGNDTLVGDSSSEQFVPGAGNDTVDGNGNGGPNPCGLGNIFVAGGDYLDLSGVAGPATFDLITGTATGDGTDAFSDMEGYIGTAGDDTLIIGDTTAANNTLVNFASDGGVDTIDGSAATVNLNLTLLFFGFDCGAAVGCLEVENAIGGSGNDVLQGNNLNNQLTGNDGADAIQGLTGNDKIEGGLGNDILDGGAGGDTLSYRHATGGMEINAVLGFTNGPDGSDTIANFEIFLGSNFNDQITGGQSSVDIPNKFKGFKGNDTLTGTNSTDTLLGGGGNDTIRAGGGDDLAKGAGGNDLLLGANGNDVLIGGGGRDTANGQQGQDQCKAENEQNCEF
jgi:hypothetical protein